MKIKLTKEYDHENPQLIADVFKAAIEMVRDYYNELDKKDTSKYHDKSLAAYCIDFEHLTVDIDGKEYQPCSGCGTLIDPMNRHFPIGLLCLDCEKRYDNEDCSGDNL